MRAGRGGMQMSFVGPGSQVRRETGADGRFEFRGLKAGDYTVSARRPGFSRATVDPVNVAEARAAEPLELVLKPGATISGVLRDKAGAGASGWYVSARAAGQGGGPAFGPGSIRSEEPTGPDGVFFLEGLTAGETYELQVMGHGRPRPAQGGRRGAGGGRRARRHRHRPDPRARRGRRQRPRDPRLPGALPARRPGRDALRDAHGPGPRARPVREAAVPRGGRLLRARGRGGGAVDGRGVRPGLPGGSASAVAVGEGEAAEGVEVRLSKGGVDHRQGARVARRTAHPRRHRARGALGRRAAHGHDPHGRRGRRQRGGDGRGGPLRDRRPRSRHVDGDRVAPGLERGDDERRAQGGARRPPTSASAGAARSAAPFSRQAARWPAPRSRSRRPGTPASGRARA